LRAAAIDTGRAAARVNIPQLPDDCRKVEPHAPLTVGVEVRSVLRRERLATDQANARVGRCAAFFDSMADGLK